MQLFHSLFLYFAVAKTPAECQAWLTVLMLLKHSWLLSKVFVLRIKSKKAKYFILLKDFIFIPPFFFLLKDATTLPRGWFFYSSVLTRFCPHRPKLHAVHLAEPCVFAAGEMRHQVFVRGPVKLICATTDDAMNYFMGPRFWVPNFFWLLQLEHFLNSAWISWHVRY